MCSKVSKGSTIKMNHTCDYTLVSMGFGPRSPPKCNLFTIFRDYSRNTTKEHKSSWCLIFTIIPWKYVFEGNFWAKIRTTKLYTSCNHFSILCPNDDPYIIGNPFNYIPAKWFCIGQFSQTDHDNVYMFGWLSDILYMYSHTHTLAKVSESYPNIDCVHTLWEDLHR